MRSPCLMTSDEYPAYRTAILNAYGTAVVPPKPSRLPPRQLRYATVHQTRSKGRVVKVEMRVIFGLLAAILLALSWSRVSKSVNTSFVERHNGTNRNRNSRKVRKTYGFSKDWAVHEAVNFCWPVRTWRVQDARGRWQPRTPAMEAGLTDHVWSMDEWLAFPTVQHRAYARNKTIRVKEFRHPKGRKTACFSYVDAVNSLGIKT
jgi:hypothetical protein